MAQFQHPGMLGEHVRALLLGLGGLGRSIAEGFLLNGLLQLLHLDGFRN